MEENNKRLIIGLDISTTCTGVSVAQVVENDIKITYIDRIKFNDIKGKSGSVELLFKKSNKFEKQFINKIDKDTVTDIIIEEPLPNSSKNINTVCTLIKFNGMISQKIYDRTGIMPKYISSYDARKFAFPELMCIRKFNKKGEVYDKNKIAKDIKDGNLVLFGEYQMDCQKKYILWNKISDMYPDITWVYNKKGELKTENFDASDSLVCILGQLNKEKYENSSPIIIENNLVDFNNNKKNKTIDNFNEFTYTVDFCNKKYKHKIVL